jgi:CMP-N-acetylneuraminic acid synthetase
MTERIAEVARRYGAEVIMRPAELSTDTASSESALLHALEHLAATENFTPELLVFLQCTSPLTQAEDIDSTVEALQREEADSAFTVVPFHSFVWKHDAQQNDIVGITTTSVCGPCASSAKSSFSKPVRFTRCAWKAFGSAASFLRQDGDVYHA